MDGLRLNHVVCLSLLLSALANCAWAQTEPATPRLARLVRTLGADAYEARQAADRELLKLGDESLAQLKEAARSKDPEVRLRAQNLLERIAVLRLWAPGRVTLEGTAMPLSAALAACAGQTGNHVALAPAEADAEQDDANLNVVIEDLPYWRALDIVARQTGHRLRVPYNPRQPGVLFSDGPVGEFPTAYAGPIRAQISSARRVYTAELDYEDTSAKVVNTLQINLQMLWEDRFRLIAYTTEPVVVEARTDTGVDLRTPVATTENWSLTNTATRQITASVKLAPPPRAANKLNLLRLRWELMALGEMTSIALDHPQAGSELHQDGVSMTVQRYLHQPTGRIELTVLVARSIPVPNPPEILFQEHTLELLDAQGHALPLQQNHPSLTRQGVEHRLVFQSENGATPTRLRLGYPTVRSRRALELEFHDVPLTPAQD